MSGSSQSIRPATAYPVRLPKNTSSELNALASAPNTADSISRAHWLIDQVEEEEQDKQGAQDSSSP